MTIYGTYKKTDYLDDVSFIAGTDYVINFDVSNEAGDDMDISSYSLRWFLSPYEQPEYPLLEKEGTLTSSSSFKIELDNSDTATLSGIFLQQPEITDISGKKIRPGQGMVIIRKAIPSQV